MREYGTGSVSQRKDGTWTGRLTVGKNEAGKPIVKAVYGKTEAEVKRKLKAVREELAKNDYVVVKKKTVATFMKDWLTSYKKNDLKPTSYDRLEMIIDKQVIPYIGAIQINSIQTIDVQNMLNKLKDEGYSYSTIKKAYDATNSCFKHGLLSRSITFNPCDAVVLPKKSMFEPTQIKFYSENEVKKLYEAARKKYSNGKKEYRVGDFVVLDVNTGLRLAELLALKWEDVDFDNKVLSVNSTRVIVKERGSESTKKNKVIEQASAKSLSGIRTIPLNDDAIDALNALKEDNNSAYVICTKDGKPVGARYLDRTFRNIQREAGFEEDRIFGIHSLRHTFATLLIKNNVDVKTVSALLGHADTNVTLNTYIHVFEEQKKNAVAFHLSVPKIV